MMQDKQAEKAFFDQLAEVKEYDVFDENGYERLISLFTQIIRPLPGEAFLDVGCGTGAFTGRLAAIGLGGIGIDLSKSSVRKASSKFPDVDFVVADAENLPFRADLFDVVIFSGVLHHLASMGDALKESHRVLKSGGRIFTYDPNRRHPAMWLYRSPMSPFSSREGLTVNERLLISEDIEYAMNEAGFVSGASFGVSGITYKYVQDSFVRKLLKLYNFLDTCLDKTLMRHHYGSFLISCATKPSDAGNSELAPPRP
jgi:ubiquinone/menaquinone biosynthesis C-methylase UbiE